MKKSFGLREMFIASARAYCRDFDRLMKGDRKAATNRLLAEVGAVRANPELSDEEKTERVNRLTTVIIALNFGLIACSLFLAKCHHSADQKRNLYEKGDFEQRAAEVLSTCVTKFDPARRASFASYAIRCITRELYNLRIQDLTIFKTGQPGRYARDVLKAIQQLGIAGERISYETICEQVHRNKPNSPLTVKKIRWLSRFLTCADDGDEGEDGNGRPRKTIVEQQPAPTQRPDEKASRKEQIRRVREVLFKNFSTTEVEIILAFFSLGKRGRTKIVAEEFGVDEKEVKRLCARAEDILLKSNLS